MFSFYKNRSLNILFVIFFIDLIFFGVLIFSFIQIKDLNNQISSLYGDLKGYESRESSLKFVNDSLKETSAQRDTVSKFFVASGKTGIADFVENLESIGRQSGVDLTVDSLLVKNEEFYDRLKINLNFEGNWDSVVYFLQFIDSMSYKIFVNRFSFDKTESGNWKCALSIDVLKLSDDKKDVE